MSRMQVRQWGCGLAKTGWRRFRCLGPAHSTVWAPVAAAEHGTRPAAMLDTVEHYSVEHVSIRKTRARLASNMQKRCAHSWAGAARPGGTAPASPRPASAPSPGRPPRFDPTLYVAARREREAAAAERCRRRPTPPPSRPSSGAAPAAQHLERI